MPPKNGIFLALLLVSILIHPSPASTAAPETELRHHLADIQKTSPGSSQERDLQKAVIALVQKMKAPPPLPQAVRRHMARGEAFVEEAKDKSGFDLAIREFQAAARAAPWLALTYFNLGVVQEKAGQYGAAMESFRMYLLADPRARDAQEVQKRIYKIEARKEAAGAQAAERQREEQARLEQERQRRQKEREAELFRLKMQLGGTWVVTSFASYRREGSSNYHYYFTISGNRFKGRPQKAKWAGTPDSFEGTINGNALNGIAIIDWTTAALPGEGGRLWRQPMTGTISADGRTLRLQFKTIRRLDSGVITQFRGWEAEPQEWILKKIR